tara:strand:- start:366 stop:569 length:204 start_codon:yes stop_codon:yes gene_type:complete
MCLGGGAPKAPPAPEPVPPAPPAVQNTVNEQAAPAPAQEETQIAAKKKGKKGLTIPLVSGEGSGLQV